jgi:putative hydrolase of the HAD superfamily
MSGGLVLRRGSSSLWTTSAGPVNSVTKKKGPSPTSMTGSKPLPTSSINSRHPREVVVLALDVDGVLLDTQRGGAGHWTSELYRRHAITRDQLRQEFFAPHWNDIVNGRRPIEPALAGALEALGSAADVEAVLSCWFDADFFLVEPVADLARRAAAAGIEIALATNQEHRRARYLRDRLSAAIPIHSLIYSADLGAQKRQPAFFELASQMLGVTSPGQVLFVDDTKVNTDQATLAGWRAIRASRDLGWIQEVEGLLALDPTTR